jgi:hypothetical protein
LFYKISLFLLDSQLLQRFAEVLTLKEDREPQSLRQAGGSIFLRTAVKAHGATSDLGMEVGMLTHLSRDHVVNTSTDMQTVTLAGPWSDPSPLSRAKVKLFDALYHLVTTLTLPGSLDDMLDALATLIMQSVEMDLCIIQLKDKAGNFLKTHTHIPDFNHKPVFSEPVTIDSVLWERLYISMIRGQLPQLNAQELDALNPLKNIQYKTLLPIPLIVGGEVLGLINCYANRPLCCNPDEASYVCSRRCLHA